MSKKTLLVLVVLLAVLAGAMWMSGRQAASPSGKSAVDGGRLLPSVDASTVRAIAIEDGVATTHLAKVDGVWSVAEQDNYPADFNRLREMMRAIDETENAQVAEEGPAHLAEFGLAADAEPAPIRVALEHAQGTTVLNLGKTREPRRSDPYWGAPAGRYVRVDEGPVLLIKEDIRMVAADPAQWWDRLLLEVAPESIRKMEVGSADGTFAIERGTNGAFAAVGAAEGETVEEGAADRLFGALGNLRAEKILAPEESAAAFSNAVSCVAETEGATYRIQLGEALADQGDGRPIKIETTAETSKRLNGRTFLIPAYLADVLVMKKDILIRKADKAPKPPPVPDAPAPETTAAP